MNNQEQAYAGVCSLCFDTLRVRRTAVPSPARCYTEEYRACHIVCSTVRLSVWTAKICAVALQETIKRAEAAEQQRLRAEREAAEKRRQRLEAGFAQVSLALRPLRPPLPHRVRVAP